MKRAALLSGIALAMAGCASTSSVTDTGPNTYTVTAKAEGLRSTAAVREAALKEATAKCSESGRSMLVVNEASEGSAYTLNFRCTADVADRPPVRR